VKEKTLGGNVGEHGEEESEHKESEKSSVDFVGDRGERRNSSVVAENSLNMSPDPVNELRPITSGRSNDS